MFSIEEQHLVSSCLFCFVFISPIPMLLLFLNIRLGQIFELGRLHQYFLSFVLFCFVLLFLGRKVMHLLK